MRVQVLIPDSLDRPMGGLGEQCRQVLRAFAANTTTDEYRFDVVEVAETPSTGGLNFELHSTPPQSLPVSGLRGNAYDVWNQAALLRMACSTDRPDVVHAYDSSSFIAGIESANYWNVPLVVTFQLSYWCLCDDVWEGRPLPESSRSRYELTLGIDMAALRSAQAVIHVSSDYATRPFFSLAADRSFIVPNGIDLDEWNVQPLPLPGDRPKKLLYIGRYDMMKNVQALVNVDVPDDVDVCFIGSTRGGNSDVYDYVRRRIDERHNFHFLGPKYGEEKRRLMRAADYQIVPSLHEPFGIVALEALASGSLLLSSFKGGMRDFLTPACALDCGTTADSITRAVRSAVDLPDEVRQIMLDTGRQVCDKYSWDAAAGQLAAVYDKVRYGTKCPERESK